MEAKLKILELEKEIDKESSTLEKIRSHLAGTSKEWEVSDFHAFLCNYYCYTYSYRSKQIS